VTTHDDGRPDPHILNIVGKLVALGPQRRDLLPVYQRWINDFHVVRNLGSFPRPITFEQEETWLDDINKSNNRTMFTIYEKTSLRPIGTTDLFAISHINRTAVFGILIGESDARGNGYGTETARLMLDYGFTALGLHSVSLSVNAGNLAGRRAYEKAGFREYGRQRQCKFVGGELCDTIHMDCLSSEFTGSVLTAVLAPDVPKV
jgi:RimJ/RimL family protein N-acetyltransferase